MLLPRHPLLLKNAPFLPRPLHLALALHVVSTVAPGYLPVPVTAPTLHRGRKQLFFPLPPNLALQEFAAAVPLPQIAFPTPNTFCACSLTPSSPPTPTPSSSPLQQDLARVCLPHELSQPIRSCLWILLFPWSPLPPSCKLLGPYWLLSKCLWSKCPMPTSCTQ